MNANRLSAHKYWLWPILFALLLTPFTPTIDLQLSKYFYQGNNQFASSKFYTFLFNYGVLPAQITCLIAIIVFIGSFLYTKWIPYRSSALLLILTLAVGAGLITHVILKDHWGRPRPKQVEEFGGTQPFRPYYEPNFFHQPQPSKSFPCGHCTMGFYFFALALIGIRRNNRRLFWIGMFLAIILGVLLSWMRIAMGGHFFSDTLFSALIMWLTAYSFHRIIPEQASRTYERFN